MSRRSLPGAGTAGMAMSCPAGAGAAAGEYNNPVLSGVLKTCAGDPAAASIASGHEFERWWQASGGPGKPWTATPAGLAGWSVVPDVFEQLGKMGPARTGRV